MSRLKKPFRLEMSKSEVIASYRAYYRRVSAFVKTTIKSSTVMIPPFALFIPSL